MRSQSVLSSFEILTSAFPVVLFQRKQAVRQKCMFWMVLRIYFKAFLEYISNFAVLGMESYALFMALCPQNVCLDHTAPNIYLQIFRRRYSAEVTPSTSFGAFFPLSTSSRSFIAIDLQILRYGHTGHSANPANDG